jgi:hypothetical protein
MAPAQSEARHALDRAEGAPVGTDAGKPAGSQRVTGSKIPVPLTDDWSVERIVRHAKPGEGEDVYEPWPGPEKAMAQAEAERALGECVRRWRDFEFRAHRVRVHEKIAAEAIGRARRNPDER